MNFIYKTIPLHTEENVPLDQVIELYFMIDMNVSTLTDQSVILFNITEQKAEPIRLSYYRRVLKIVPSRKLNPLQHYQLQIIGGESGVKDITDHAMEETYEVEFYTKDVISIKPPRILSPSHTSVLTERPTVRLEPNDQADFYQIQISKSNTFQNLIWPVSAEQIFETAITPDAEYQTGQYYMRARSVGKDRIASAWSPVISFYFDGETKIEVPDDPEVLLPEAEEPKQDTAFDEYDNILTPNTSVENELGQLQQLQDAFILDFGDKGNALHVVNVSIKNNSVHNKLSKIKNVEITFSEDIDESSITKDSCYILSERN